MLSSLANPNLTLTPNGGALISGPNGFEQASQNLNAQASTSWVIKQSDGNWLLSTTSAETSTPPASPTYYVSNTGNDGLSHTGSISDPLATPQEACRRLAASGWTGVPTISVDNAIALGANPIINIPTPTGGGQPVTIESTSYTDSGMGTRTASGGAAPGATAPPTLGTVVDNAGGLTPNAWAGWYLRWTSGPNSGLRASISANSATTYTVEAGSFGATANGNTYVVEKPSGSFTFSSRFVISGKMLRINGLDIVGTVDGFEGSIFDNEVDLYQEFGVRYIAPGGGSGLGMTCFFSCGSIVSGLYLNLAIINTFVGLPFPTDVAPCQFLGTSTDIIAIQYSTGAGGASAGATAAYFGPNFQYSNVQAGMGAKVSMSGPFPFNGSSIYSNGGASINVEWMVGTANVAAPASTLSQCFYADYGSFQNYYECSVNGVMGAVSLFGSGFGGIIDPFFVTGTNGSATGQVYAGYYGGQYFPFSSFNSVTDSSGFGQVKLIESIPIVNVTDADQIGFLPQALPANVFMVSGATTTSGGSVTSTVVTATLPTEASGAQHNFYCECVIQGYRTDVGGVGASFATKLHCLYTNPAGTPTQIGTDQSLVTSETFNSATEAGCTVASAASAQNLIFKVITPVGFAVGHNLRWTGTVTITMSNGF